MKLIIVIYIHSQVLQNKNYLLIYLCLSVVAAGESFCLSAGGAAVASDSGMMV
jgi:hypothetical protein